MNLFVRKPDASELIPMKEVLAAHGLPTDDFDSSPIDWLLAVQANGALGGMVGLEMFEGAALLRSLVAVTPGRGVGSQLLTIAEEAARAAGVRHVYLLTQTAADYFAKRGYKRVERASAPSSLLSTSEFRSLCPASATCMMRELV